MNYMWNLKKSRISSCLIKQLTLPVADMITQREDKSAEQKLPETVHSSRLSTATYHRYACIQTIEYFLVDLSRPKMLRSMWHNQPGESIPTLVWSSWHGWQERNDERSVAPLYVSASRDHRRCLKRGKKVIEALTMFYIRGRYRPPTHSPTVIFSGILLACTNCCADRFHENVCIAFITIQRKFMR